ncbi:MAG: hypothetical protein OEW04_06940 [Nitrospirota bacterium]|nr:hypothetical protein [Nitrospirota bacterium]
MKHKVIAVIFILITVIAVTSYAQTPTDYLILQDIDSYIFITQAKDFITGQPKTILGYSTRGGSGILAGVDHFSSDHTDTTYETDYINRTDRFDVEIQVTQHTGGDSDKWLMHEVERDFRTYYGLPDDSFVARQIDNNTIIGLSVAGWTYRWISGNKVIQIQYHDSQMEKPEPLEVVQAYLAKHPSTLPAITSADLRTSDNKTAWTKDEMERRLWLCDKWFEQLQTGKVDQKKALQESVRSMNIFLDYREKYYGLKAADEKSLLAGYLSANNEAGIKTKLQEYKAWWGANKSGSIIGILSVYTHKIYNHVSQFIRNMFTLLTSALRSLMAMFG